MKRVSVVGTVHAEEGFADVPELLKILSQIAPDVIFLEIPETVFDDNRTGVRRNLESTAARQYRNNRHVDLIPVDLPTPDEEFFRNDRQLHEAIERKSSEYRRLVDWHSQYVRAYGFAYLNSDHYSTLAAQLHQAMLAAIAELGDRRLAELYDFSIRTDELRDIAMVASIEGYPRRIAYTNAPLLVGASHRRSIRGLTTAKSVADAATVEWDFAGFLDAPR